MELEDEVEPSMEEKFAMILRASVRDFSPVGSSHDIVNSMILNMRKGRLTKDTWRIRVPRKLRKFSIWPSFPLGWGLAWSLSQRSSSDCSAFV